MEYITLLFALIGIVIGADVLVSGSVSLARRFNISDFVIGALIVGVGTSMPELTVSLIGALNGNAEVAIGNVVGSNIFNVLGILGITALLFPITVTKENKKFEIPFCILVSGLLILLVFNFFCSPTAMISRIDGILLLVVFCLFMWYSLYKDRKKADLVNNDIAEEPQKSVPVWISIVKIVGGLALLITSCDIFVDDAVKIARNLGLDDAFISITLIACGTSLPELAASITAAVKKNTQLALGNILGSNIFNICLILGLSSLVTPLSSPSITIIDYLVMIVAAVMTLLLCHKGKINRIGGLIMFVMFVVYCWYLLSNQTAI